MSKPEAVDTGVPVIAVDGPGGSGKGTITTRLANHLGWHFLDSGALYRLTALAVMKRQVPLEDEAGLGEVAANLDIRFETSGNDVITWLDGEDVSDRLRHEDTGVLASKIAVIPAVRAALTGRQRRLGQMPMWAYVVIFRPSVVCASVRASFRKQFLFPLFYA